MCGDRNQGQAGHIDLGVGAKPSKWKRTHSACRVSLDPNLYVFLSYIDSRIGLEKVRSDGILWGREIMALWGEGSFCYRCRSEVMKADLLCSDNTRCFNTEVLR